VRIFLASLYTPLRTEAAPAAAVKACHRARPGLALVNHARASRGVGKACNGSLSVSARLGHQYMRLDISINPAIPYPYDTHNWQIVHALRPSAWLLPSPMGLGPHLVSSPRSLCPQCPHHGSCWVPALIVPCSAGDMDQCTLQSPHRITHASGAMALPPRGMQWQVGKILPQYGVSAANMTAREALLSCTYSFPGPPQCLTSVVCASPYPLRLHHRTSLSYATQVQTRR
jgi:hypothetical protein